jgi:hypothetical protein
MKATTTLNPEMRELTLDEVKAELPKTIRQIRSQKAALSQFTYGSAGWTAVAKSHDNLVLQARRFRSFINAHARAEQAQADFIRRMLSGEVAAEVEALIAELNAL